MVSAKQKNQISSMVLLADHLTIEDGQRKTKKPESDLGDLPGRRSLGGVAHQIAPHTPYGKG